MTTTTHRKQRSACLFSPKSSIPDSFLSVGSHDHGDRPLSLHLAQLSLYEDICSYLPRHHRDHSQIDSGISAVEYILEWSRRTCHHYQRIRKVEVNKLCNMFLSDLINSSQKTGSDYTQLWRMCPRAQVAVFKKFWKHMECVFEVVTYNEIVADEAKHRVSRQCSAGDKESLNVKRRRDDNDSKKPCYPQTYPAKFQPRYKSWYNCKEEVYERAKKLTKRETLRPAPVITKTKEIDQHNTLSEAPPASRERIMRAKFSARMTHERYGGSTRATIALLEAAGQSAAVIPPGKVFKETMKPELAVIISQQIVDLVESRMEGR